MPTRLRAAFPAILLFLLNVVLVHDLFTAEYTIFRGSIESTYIALARYTLAHFPDFRWFPLWYGGIPIQNAYPPLLYCLTAAWSVVARITPALAYHQLVAIVYCAAPVTLYCLLTRLGASRRAAWLSGLAYSLLSPTAILIPIVAGDIGGRWNARRLQVLLTYGEGPHELAVALIPVALIALDLLLARRTPARIVFATCTIAAIALTNWLGSFALALAILCYLIALRKTLRHFAIAAVTALLSYGLTCAWLPPSTIATVQRDSRTLTLGYDPRRMLILLAACAFCFVLAYLLRKRNIPAAFTFFVTFALLTAVLVIPGFRWHWPVVPQSERYHIEMDLALCGLAGLVFDQILRRLPSAIVLAVATWFGIVGCGQVARLYNMGLDFTRHDDATHWSEYHAAQWLQQNLHTGRAFLPGSFFWVNAWTDVPQLGGDFNNGIYNWQTDVAEYVVYSGEGAGARDPEVSRLWLEALGVHAVVVSEAQGKDWFHSIRNPRKFAGLFPEVWREGHDVIYRIDRVPGDLAHVVPSAAIVAHPPADGVDTAAIAAYVAALEASDPAAATLHWQDQHTLAIRTRITAPNQTLTIQESWHPGWVAQANGKPLDLHPDGLGLMAIDNLPAGDLTIVATFQPPLWPWLVFAFSLLLLAGPAALAAFPLSASRVFPKP